MFYHLLLIASLAWISAESGKKGRAPRVVCRPGPRGDKGKSGWPGPAGFVGAAGSPGIDGQNATITTTSSFFNVFIDEPLTGIADLSIIPFNSVEAISSLADFAFDSTSGIILVGSEGVYYATFMVAAHAVSRTDPTAFGLYVNGVPAAGGCKYLSKTGQYYVWGQCLFPASAGASVTIVNLSGQSVDLWDTDIPATPFVAVKASLMMYKVSTVIEYTVFSSS